MNFYNLLLNLGVAFAMMLFLLWILTPWYPTAICRQRQPERQQNTHIICGSPPPKINTSAISDAIAGMVSLGYKKLDAKERVQKAWELSRSDDVETLIKEAMKV